LILDLDVHSRFIVDRMMLIIVLIDQLRHEFLIA
jgi:hypothetical protein